MNTHSKIRTFQRPNAKTRMVFILCYDFAINNISRTSKIETQLAKNIITSKEMTGSVYKPCNPVSYFRRLTSLLIFLLETQIKLS
jgi:hypothetical protein